MTTRRLRIVTRKLGRERAWGQQEPGLIEIDSRLKGRRRLNVLLHEAIHEAFPRVSETGVLNAARTITAALWQQGYRRVEE
jgi:hypothetical protein